MNTAQLKIASWSLAGLFGVALGGYVSNYLVNRAELQKRVTAAEVQASLSKVAPVEKRAEDIVAYDRVNQALFKFNWTGKPPPPKPVETRVEEPTKPGTEPVSNFVRVMMVKADLTDDSGSRVVIKYLAPAKVTIPSPTVVKHVGDTLDAPLDWITVASIVADGAYFKFADANRAEEKLIPNELPYRLDMDALARDGVTMSRPEEVTFRRTATYDVPPKNTVNLGGDYYHIGTDDMDYWNESYEQALSEVEFDRHRDPSTGKYDGIKLKNVPAGSVAAAHGAKEGDVIKSINGHAVNSPQEAISFAKNNKDKYDVWVVEVDSKGKTKFITYKVPKKN